MLDRLAVTSFETVATWMENQSDSKLYIYARRNESLCLLCCSKMLNNGLSSALSFFQSLCTPADDCFYRTKSSLFKHISVYSRRPPSLKHFSFAGIGSKAGIPKQQQQCLKSTPSRYIVTCPSPQAYELPFPTLPLE